MKDPFDTGKPCFCDAHGICGNCYSHQVNRAEQAEQRKNELEMVLSNLTSHFGRSLEMVRSEFENYMKDLKK